MGISKEQVSHVARLARLSFTDDELDRFTDQLSKILEHAAQVSNLATEDVPPTAHPLPLHNVFRPDVVEPSLPHHKAISTAPDEEDGRFKVPRIIEERS
ncbi:MAG: Asp-tRNA(Asn)/Glu-tRNA(Gln) amidotransferase subunit GatC [Actinomycetota bacterium]